MILSSFLRKFFLQVIKYEPCIWDHYQILLLIKTIVSRGKSNWSREMRFIQQKISFSCSFLIFKENGKIWWHKSSFLLNTIYSFYFSPVAASNNGRKSVKVILRNILTHSEGKYLNFYIIIRETKQLISILITIMLSLRIIKGSYILLPKNIKSAK